MATYGYKSPALVMGDMRVKAMGELPRADASRMQAAVSTEERAIERLIATLQRPEIEFKKKFEELEKEKRKAITKQEKKTIDEKVAKLHRDLDEDNQQKLNAATVFYRQVAELYYDTKTADLDHIKRQIAPRLTALESDIKKSILDEPQQKPFLGIIHKAQTNVNARLRLLGQIGTKAKEFFGNRMVQGAVAAAATNSPLIGMFVAAYEHTNKKKTDFQMQQGNLEHQEERREFEKTPSSGSSSTSTSSSRTSGSSATLVPLRESTRSQVPSATQISTNTAGPDGAGGSGASEGSGEPRGSGVIKILNQHTKLLDGIYKTLNLQMKLQEHLNELTALGNAEAQNENGSPFGKRGVGGLGGGTGLGVPSVDSKGILSHLAEIGEMMFGIKSLYNIIKSIKGVPKGIWTSLKTGLTEFGVFMEGIGGAIAIPVGILAAQIAAAWSIIKPVADVVAPYERAKKIGLKPLPSESTDHLQHRVDVYTNWLAKGYSKAEAWNAVTNSDGSDGRPKGDHGRVPIEAPDAMNPNDPNLTPTKEQTKATVSFSKPTPPESSSDDVPSFEDTATVVAPEPQPAPTLSNVLGGGLRTPDMVTPLSVTPTSPTPSSVTRVPSPEPQRVTPPVTNLRSTKPNTSINSRDRRWTGTQEQLNSLRGEGKGRWGEGDYAKFYQSVRSAASQAAKGFAGNVSGDAIIANMVQESGWGKATSGDYNYFNIKADPSWKGGTKWAWDHDASGRPEVALFRSYASPQEAIDDYVKMINEQKNFKLAASAKNDAEFFTQLKAGGYAEDPEYVSKLMGRLRDVQRVGRQLDAHTSADATVAGRSAVTQELVAGAKTNGRPTPPVIINNNTVQAPSVAMGGGRTRTALTSPTDMSVTTDMLLR